ncbi:hypothetical protein CFBP3846_P400001 (plasmid) [Pseudomonas syringae pv. avii]|uniref:Uncharacterized protein n=1 Tax=Pseudomonas syringae pv. avii TaxID=663959 RepID=A0ABY1UG40_PSESX|nr:hypothetical protein CFBP3846_P400001 [Pseudomonas syringae pv. avii]
MRSGHSAKFLGAGQTYKAAEVLQVILVRTTRARVVDIGEPLRRRWHAGQLLKLDGCKPAITGNDQI